MSAQDVQEKEINLEELNLAKSLTILRINVSNYEPNKKVTISKYPDPKNLVSLNEFALMRAGLSYTLPEFPRQVKSLILSYNDGLNAPNLEDFNNLEELYLKGNRIKDIRFLNSLNNLNSLDLSNNKIKYIQLISSLKKLKDLDLSNNEIKDITPISSLNNLNTLNLSNNEIENINAISSLNNLSILYLNENKISDFSYIPNNRRVLTFADDQKISGEFSSNIIDNPLRSPDGDVIKIKEDSNKGKNIENNKIEILNFENINIGDEIDLKFEEKYGVIDISGTLKLTKVAPKNVESISLEPKNSILTTTGQTLQINIAFTPKDATNKNVTWTSSDKNVATVDSNGLVTAVANGNTTITATTQDGNKTASVEIKVNIPTPPAPQPDKNVISISLKAVKTNLTAKNETSKITVEFNPEDATNKNVTWTSSNPSLATVDNNGLVTAVANGKTTITATTQDGNKTASVEIEVNIPSSDNKTGDGGGGGGGSSAPTKRNIDIDSSIKHGKIEIDTKKSESGKKITVKPVPDKGYKLKNIQVIDEKGNKISLTENKDKTYSFNMPISKVTIKAEFEKEEMKKEEPKKQEPKIKQKVNLKIGSKTLVKTQDGKVTNIPVDVAPFIKNSRTMMPVRFVAESLGIEVKWDTSTRTIIMKDGKKTILIPIDTNKIIVDGKEYISDVKPIIENSRTYLSISNIAKALGLEEGKDIIWNSETKEVTISVPEEIK